MVLLYMYRTYVLYCFKYKLSKQLYIKKYCPCFNIFFKKMQYEWNMQYEYVYTNFAILSIWWMGSITAVAHGIFFWKTVRKRRAPKRSHVKANLWLVAICRGGLTVPGGLREPAGGRQTSDQMFRRPSIAWNRQNSSVQHRASLNKQPGWVSKQKASRWLAKQIDCHVWKTLFFFFHLV